MSEGLDPRLGCRRTLVAAHTETWASCHVIVQKLGSNKIGPIFECRSTLHRPLCTPHVNKLEIFAGL
jgi:hypothetical protein